MKFLVAIVLIAVAYIWTISLKAQGKIESVSGFLRRIFLDPKDGLVLTRWLGKFFPPKR